MSQSATAAAPSRTAASVYRFPIPIAAPVIRTFLPSTLFILATPRRGVIDASANLLLDSTLLPRRHRPMPFGKYVTSGPWRHCDPQHQVSRQAEPAMAAGPSPEARAARQATP